jgi:hypothetical protein
MKLKLSFILLFSTVTIFAQAQLVTPDHEKVNGGELTIQPITHATLVLSFNKIIFMLTLPEAPMPLKVLLLPT